MRKPKLTYIHVNQHKIRANKTKGTNEPVIAIKQGKKKNTYCFKAKIHGPSEIVYSGNENTLLSCGARVAIVTQSEVEVLE